MLTGALSHRLRWLLLTSLVTACLLAPHAGADDKAATIPAALRGTWVLRLTSDDRGKTYLSGDNQPVCEVADKTVTFLRKGPWGEGKLTVKSVAETKAGNASYHLIRFENGKAWKISANSGSITVMLVEGEDDKLTESYRFVTRKKP